jgi:hypothetical protein
MSYLTPSWMRCLPPVRFLGKSKSDMLRSWQGCWGRTHWAAIGWHRIIKEGRAGAARGFLWLNLGEVKLPGRFEQKIGQPVEGTE